jgi:hypothetical protein
LIPTRIQSTPTKISTSNSKKINRINDRKTLDTFGNKKETVALATDSPSYAYNNPDPGKLAGKEGKPQRFVLVAGNGLLSRR